ncbi:hypothetical protein JZ751_010951 [Albula glossodonta]|uniref:Uncharacterized protein n=1 Tax=Albula glossodonta TaxID=121402 RepID=A0A8T2P3S8_9TELE|nr:hypothetical protein JZ751_010951 [Albula glossodonta]
MRNTERRSIGLRKHMSSSWSLGGKAAQLSPWLALLNCRPWLRSGVAAPRPRRIRRSESLQREEAAVVEPLLQCRVPKLAG